MKFKEADKTVAYSLILFFSLFALNILIKNTFLSYTASITPLAFIVYKTYSNKKNDPLREFVRFSLIVGLVYPLVELLVWPIGWGEYLIPGPYILYTPLNFCFIVPFSIISVSYLARRLSHGSISLAIFYTFLISFPGDVFLHISNFLIGDIVYYNMKTMFWLVPLAAPLTDSLAFATLPLAYKIRQPFGVLFFCAALAVIWTIFYPLI